MAEATVRGSRLQQVNGPQTTCTDGNLLHGTDTDSKATKKQVEVETYQRLVGDLLYLGYFTCPDLAFIVFILGAAVNHALSDLHLEMLKSPLRYVHQT